MPEVNVVIEVFSGSGPIKYDRDKSGNLFVDSFLTTPTPYPCHYGYILNTFNEDQQPLDALIVTPRTIDRRCEMRCRPVGILAMRDNAGSCNKIVLVPTYKITNLYNQVKSFEDLPLVLLDQIIHFFTHYHDEDNSNEVAVEGWIGSEAAEVEVLDAMKRYENGLVKEKLITS